MLSGWSYRRHEPNCPAHAAACLWSHDISCHLAEGYEKADKWKEQDLSDLMVLIYLACQLEQWGRWQVDWHAGARTHHSAESPGGVFRPRQAAGISSHQNNVSHPLAPLPYLWHIVHFLPYNSWWLTTMRMIITRIILLRLIIISVSSVSFLVDLVRKISQHTGEPLEVQFLFQRISVLIQRFNSVLFHETFPVEDDTDT